jgi:glycosyltransferase involved in cell wall biosynthesis
VELTVVILAYNSARTITACLTSVDRQSRPPAEILVVDDDSTDDTLAKVRSFAADSAIPVRIVRNGHRNISRGRNLGLAAVSTPLLAFLDSDAWAEPEWVAELTAAFTRSDAAIVGGGVVAAHATRFAEAVAVSDGAVRDLAARGTLLFSTCNMAMHTGRIGGERFDERWVYAEDVEYVHRVGNGIVVPAARVWHESRATVRGYLRQMYRYGLWKVRFTAHTRQVRLVDYSATAALVLSAAAGLIVSPWLLLAYPALCAAETAAVVLLRRPRPALLPLMFVGWLVKNTGWGLGVLVALAQQAVGRSGVPGAADRRATVAG